MLLHLPDASLIGKEAVCPQCKHRFLLKAPAEAKQPPPRSVGLKKGKPIQPPPASATPRGNNADTISLVNPMASSVKEESSPKTEDSSVRFPPPPKPAARRQPTNTRLGDFTLIEELGRGAFGTVYRARDEVLCRQVAIKVPKATLYDSLAPEEFVKEAQLAAQLRHPNILTVLQVGVADGTPFIVTDLVEGTDLAAVIRKGPLKPRTAANLCRKIASALHLAHQVGIIHRDLKPANILIDKSREPLIADFGLAKSLNAETSTTDGVIKGTPAYMSPEQASGRIKETDGRSDLFSLGIILFEMLTGARPFQGDSWSVLHKIVTEQPPSLRSIKADVPVGLESICMRCLAKDPNRRYPDAKSLAQDLAGYLQGKSLPETAVWMPPPVPRKPKQKSSGLWLGVVGTAVFTMLVGLGSWILWPHGKPQAVGANNEIKPPSRRQTRQTPNPEPELQEVPSRDATTGKLTGRKITTDPQGLVAARTLLKQAREASLDVQFLETPLRDLTDFLADLYATNIFLEVRALEEEGLSEDEPITARSLSKVSLEAALDPILTPIGLTWIPKGYGQNEKWDEPPVRLNVVITTQSDAEERFETILYPIGELVETQRDVENLIASLKQDQEISWADTHGSGGTVTFLDAGQLLSINQTWDAHKRIISYLDRLKLQPQPLTAPETNPNNASQGNGGGAGGGGLF